MEIEDLLLYSKPKVIGSGTLPADPSLYQAGGIWVDENKNAWQQQNGEWVGVGTWLVVNGEFVTLNGEQILVDSPFNYIDGAII